MSLDVLSPRERQVTLLIFDGLQSKQIADRLKISLKTVFQHRRHTLEKLGAVNFAEVAWKVRIPDGEQRECIA
jgi:DNA-binding CsgD family transcriptional regulator